MEDLKERIAEMEARIGELPRGSVSTKRVNGHLYAYHRWYEGKKKREKYVPAGDLERLKAGIAERRELERQCRELRKQLPKERSVVREAGTEYGMVVRRGPALRAFSAEVAGFRKRECYRQLRDYIFGGAVSKVLVMFGLRRTGKTTMIRQVLAEMSDDMLAHTAFVQMTGRNTLAELNRDLQKLEGQGCRYVFLDEVTRMEDFIEGAALFPDIFAASGMKIVLSGTDSLGFLFARDEQLYDRCIFLHTTFIPYREFERVLGIKGIDEYIRYGGTMSMDGVNYNETSTFSSADRAGEYVDSAIARNIQNSLRCYQQAGHFRKLRELYEKNELTSAINRVVEDQTHRFALEVLTREFRSNDLSISARNLRSDREHPTDILDRIDLREVMESLRNRLEILEREEQTVRLEPGHVTEIRECLTLLDLIHTVGIRTLPVGDDYARTVVAQPGLRYAQAQALIGSLLLDPVFSDLSLEERDAVQSRIMSEIQGRMMEDAVLLETSLSDPRKQVFVLQFAVGEFDMVVFDPDALCCRIFEIKHSAQTSPEQVRHLTDGEKCRMTEHRFGKIEGKYVIYRGKEQTIGGIRYLNVEDYLCGLAAEERH